MFNLDLNRPLAGQITAEADLSRYRFINGMFIERDRIETEFSIGPVVVPVSNTHTLSDPFVINLIPQDYDTRYFQLAIYELSFMAKLTTTSAPPPGADIGIRVVRNNEIIFPQIRSLIKNIDINDKYSTWIHPVANQFINIINGLWIIPRPTRYDFLIYNETSHYVNIYIMVKSFLIKKEEI